MVVIPKEIYQKLSQGEFTRTVLHAVLSDKSVLLGGDFTFLWLPMSVCGPSSLTLVYGNLE